jgi:S1-C subfamily serine protease
MEYRALPAAILASVSWMQCDRDRRPSVDDASLTNDAIAPAFDGGAANVIATQAFGLLVQDAPGGGAVVMGLAPGSPAASLLKPGDVILEVDRVPVRDAAELARQLQIAKQGVGLLKIHRGEALQWVALTGR